MKRSILLAYQLLTGVSDTSTGILLIAAPEFTLRLMKLHAAPEALPYLSYVGVFVLSVGIACLYGGWLAARGSDSEQLGVVWLLTAIPRGLVAVFVIAKIATGALDPGWSTVAITDGLLALVQGIGLAKGWLRHVRA